VLLSIITFLSLWILYYLNDIEFNKTFNKTIEPIMGSVILLYRLLRLRSNDILYYNDYNDIIDNGYFYIKTNQYGLCIYNKIYILIIKLKCYKFERIDNNLRININKIIDISDDWIFFSDYKYYVGIRYAALVKCIIRERNLKELGF
jgi:hypothetical protein